MSSNGPVNRAYLALGSNIEPARNLIEAVRQLAGFGRVVVVSRVWESEPVGFADQPNFLNAALLLETPLSARDFHLGAIETIERLLHRVRDSNNKNAPRTIDVDLALFNREILRIDHRRIPDPDILTRPFVAIPLAELDPGYVHPEDGRTLQKIAEGFVGSTPSLKLRRDIRLDGGYPL